ncbi:head completion/stabilization protein [Paraburkholderia sp. SIMBA_030]|uniref:head completion/stabilization protein n=1 Tax=Paraburkholderia sp. SIMBA_030 TaxID=3085773 RepID=UPI00397935F0
MSSFYAIAEPNITPEPTPPAAELIVTNTHWFPSVDLAHMRQAVRLDGTVTHARLRDAVIAAIDEVNRELSTWRQAHQAAGVATLAELPADDIGGESVHLARYRRAVYYLARADVTEQYRDFDSTKSGAADAAELETTIDADRRNARHAINDMRGAARTTVELI